ncbi:hypothetical protein GQX73_g396 [Xylaria multiplex]|uniref:Uncharacterized protein n=1 Tax=Xylaria multiplex TaxID=323545 RepID=A0A7C8MT88_9PEZI|nr:hypothetical protein GQX73_g396 [Xylaria multiplex]
MPSWVPDWADKTERIRAFPHLQGFLKSYDSYECYRDFGFEPGSEGRLLRVKGRKLGCIDEVGPVLMSGKMDIIAREEAVKNIVADLVSMMHPIHGGDLNNIELAISETDSESITESATESTPESTTGLEFIDPKCLMDPDSRPDPTWETDDSETDSELEYPQSLMGRVAPVSIKSIVYKDSEKDLEFMADPESLTDVEPFVDTGPAKDIYHPSWYPDAIRKGKHNLKRKAKF